MKKLLNILALSVLVINGTLAQGVIVHISDSTESKAFENHLRASIATTRNIAVRTINGVATTLRKYRTSTFTSSTSQPQYAYGEAIIQETATVEKKKVISKSFPVDAKNF